MISLDLSRYLLDCPKLKLFFIILLLCKLIVISQHYCNFNNNIITFYNCLKKADINILKINQVTFRWFNLSPLL